MTVARFTHLRLFQFYCGLNVTTSTTQKLSLQLQFSVHILRQSARELSLMFDRSLRGKLHCNIWLCRGQFGVEWQVVMSIIINEPLFEGKQ